MTNAGYSHRTQHLGVDFWLPPTTAIHSPFDGEVVYYGDNGQDKDYGYTLLCKHTTGKQAFYLLYGHLQKTDHVQIGDQIHKGQRIALIGHVAVNGGCHLQFHFLFFGELLDQETTFYGVCDPADEDFWAHICPDPSLIFQEDFNNENQLRDRHLLLQKRSEVLGKSLSLQYKEPLYTQRGDDVFLIDEYGQKYIDTINNVAHVGHENSSVVQAGIDQMTLLNTNTRYVHTIL